MSSAGPSTAAPTAPQTFTPFIAYFFEDEPDDFVGHRAFFASGVIASLSDTRTGGLRFDLGQNSYTYTVPIQSPVATSARRAWFDKLEEARSLTNRLSDTYLAWYQGGNFHPRRRKQRERIESICKSLGSRVVEVTDNGQWGSIKTAPHSVGVYPLWTELPSLPPAPMKTIICWSHRREGDATSSQYILEAGLGAVLPVWDTTEADGSVIKLNGEEAMRIIDPRSFRAYQRKTEFSSVTNPNLPEVEGFVETMSGTGSPLLLYAAGSINETVAAQLVEEKAGLLHRELKSCLVRGMFSKEFPSLLSDGLLTRINLGDQWGTQ
jgi:hypothetical protein